MTPKEKANELMANYRSIPILFWDEIGSNHKSMQDNEAKACALLCIDEIIKCQEFFDDNEGTTFGQLKYWMQVKDEVENL